MDTKNPFPSIVLFFFVQFQPNLPWIGASPCPAYDTAVRVTDRQTRVRGIFWWFIGFRATTLLTPSDCHFLFSYFVKL
jgi:hypothetical protein